MVEQDKCLKDLQSSLALLRQLRIALPLSAALLAGLWWAPPDLQVNFSGCACGHLLDRAHAGAHPPTRHGYPAAGSSRRLRWVSSFGLPASCLLYGICFSKWHYQCFARCSCTAFQKIDSTACAPLIYISAYVALSAVLMQINRVLRAENRRLIFQGDSTLPFGWTAHGVFAVCLARAYFHSLLSCRTRIHNCTR